MEWLRIGAAVLITLIWAFLYLSDVYRQDYSVPPEVSAVMMLAATWLFTGPVRKRLTELIRQEEEKDDAHEAKHKENQERV